MSTSQAILLVASNQRNLDLLSDFLSSAGFETKCAKNLQGFDSLIEGSNGYGLALVDISGFSRDIWNSCDRLSSQNTPFLIIVPQGQQRMQYESLAHGAKGVLYKPLIIKELLGTISELFVEA